VKCRRFNPNRKVKRNQSRAGVPDLRGGFLVEVVGGTLSVSGCRKNSAIVILQNFQPSRDIGGVFFPRLLVQFEVGT
jgi:hypothetical protein